jgi:hypothetical protein
MQRIPPAFVFGIVMLLAGCDSKSSLIPVKGKVTYQGVPLEKGLVHFEAIDGKSPSAKGGIIENGAYSAHVPAGELRVKITSDKVVGKRPMYKDMPDSKMIDISEQFIPKKYNTETALKVTIQSRRDDLDFHLEK